MDFLNFHRKNDFFDFHSVGKFAFPDLVVQNFDIFTFQTRNLTFSEMIHFMEFDLFDFSDKFFLLFD